MLETWAKFSRSKKLHLHQDDQRRGIRSNARTPGYIPSYIVIKTMINYLGPTTACFGTIDMKQQ